MPPAMSKPPTSLALLYAPTGSAIILTDLPPILRTRPSEGGVHAQVSCRLGDIQHFLICQFEGLLDRLLRFRSYREDD
eukprot:4547081-Heterocapsa_arctica.AAC.1